MEMEEAFEQKHRQHASDHPEHELLEGVVGDHGVREHVQQGDAEHEPADERVGELQPLVGQSNVQRDPPAQQGCRDDRNTVQAEISTK